VISTTDTSGPDGDSGSPGLDSEDSPVGGAQSTPGTSDDSSLDYIQTTATRLIYDPATGTVSPATSGGTSTPFQFGINLNPAQVAVQAGAINGGGTFVNTISQVNGAPITVIVSVNSAGIVSAFTFYDPSTGIADYLAGGASMNATTEGGLDLGQFLEANPNISGTIWVNPYAPKNQ
jgi:hypothetical protein